MRGMKRGVPRQPKIVRVTGLAKARTVASPKGLLGIAKATAKQARRN